MKFRCPSYGFTGIIRVPDYFPRGKKVAINCAKCNYKFSLTTGKLWPSPGLGAEYRALMALEAETCSPLHGSRGSHM